MRVSTNKKQKPAIVENVRSASKHSRGMKRGSSIFRIPCSLSLVLGIDNSIRMTIDENVIKYGPALLWVLSDTQHKRNEVTTRNNTIKVPIPTPNI